MTAGGEAVRGNLIAGEWVQGDGVTSDVNPSDLDDVVGAFATADAVQAEAAVAAAAAAAPRWASSTPQERFDVLEAVGSELAARARELGETLAREEGKPLAEATAEVQRAAMIFRYYAGEALRIPGEHHRSVRPGVDVDVIREPVGVVGIITPWNFPIAIPAWKIAPALAFGNTVVCKPAELVPASAWALVDIIARTQIPPGVVNLVNGPGRVVGEAMLADPRVRAVSFTGSQETGARVAQVMAARFGRVQLEMGGKNPLVVLDDADLDVAVEVAVQGAYHQTGQRCTASSRLIATGKIHDAFVEALADRVRTLRVGHALDPETQIGPVVSEAQFEQDLSYLRIGEEEGAVLLAGGEVLERPTRGYYLQPALLVDTTNEMRVNREEIFGPIATMQRADDPEHALALANDTPFGLSAGVVTTSLAHATRFRDGLQAGLVMVNLPTAGVDFHVPFGGTKGSSMGTREQGRHAVEFYTTVKTAYVKP